jgi:hypothetical protein
MSRASAAGTDLHIQASGNAEGGGAEGDGQDISPADAALLIYAGLGLKRALPWAQVKGALVRASLSNDVDPVLSVSDELGVPSLRTSTAPIKRFVGTARSMNLPAFDISTVLDVGASAQDMGEVIAALGEKDKRVRLGKWRAAGVPARLLRPLDSVRAHALKHVGSLPSSPVPDHKAVGRAQEMLGALLAEGSSISDELESVPIETYSAHPFTLGERGTVAPVFDDVPVAGHAEQAEQVQPATGAAKGTPASGAQSGPQGVTKPARHVGGAKSAKGTKIAKSAEAARKAQHEGGNHETQHP